MKKAIIPLLLFIVFIGAGGYELQNTYARTGAFRDALARADGPEIRHFLAYEEIEKTLTKKLSSEMAKQPTTEIGSQLPEVQAAKNREIADEVNKISTKLHDSEFLSKIFSTKGFSSPINYSISLKDFNSVELYNEVNKFRFTLRRFGLSDWRVVEIIGAGDKLLSLMRGDLN